MHDTSLNLLSLFAAYVISIMAIVENVFDTIQMLKVIFAFISHKYNSDHCTYILI